MSTQANPTGNIPAPSIMSLLQGCLKKDEAIPALTVDQIDECIADFESSERLFASAKATHDEARQAVIALVKQHGNLIPQAEQSKRILGRRNQATITVGTTTTVSEDAVNDLEDYLRETAGLDGADIFDRLFAEETKHKLIDGARNVLSKIQLPKRIHEKVLSLFGRCFDVKPKAPSLKVVAIEPAKPARKPRAGKAAA